MLPLLLTLKGTPFLYNGEEIGMTDLIITEPIQTARYHGNLVLRRAGQRI